MSPEQASGRRALVDRRTDIYSLGASLYELATLQPAFPEEDPHRLLQQIVTDPPQLPSRIDNAIPFDLETIILKAMAKEPSDRYETARDLADDLRRFVKHEPIRARRITKLEHARSWCRRNKAVASLLATVIALLLILSIGGPLTAIKQSQLVRQVQEELDAKNLNQLYQGWYSGSAEHVSVELMRHFETADPGEFLFEWELLRQQYEDSRQTVFYENFDRQTHLMSFVRFSPRGDVIACGQPGDRISIYDVKRKAFRPLGNEPEGNAADAVFSADGKELITVSWTGVINRREVATGKVIGPVIHCGAGDRSVEWVKWYNAIHLTEDGKTVVVAMDNGQSGFLVIVQLENGECTRIAAHDGSIGTCALSPNGAMLVSSGEDGLIKFWDLKGNQLHLPLPCSYVYDIQFTADGRKLMLCDHVNGISVLDATSLAELPGLRGEQRYISRLAISAMRSSRRLE